MSDVVSTCVTCHMDYATIGNQCRTCWKTTPAPPDDEPPKATTIQPVGYYVVEKGDSLGKIAEAFEVDIHDVLKANPQITNPDLIYPGDTIAVPGRWRILPLVRLNLNK